MINNTHAIEHQVLKVNGISVPKRQLMDQMEKKGPTMSINITNAKIANAAIIFSESVMLKGSI